MSIARTSAAGREADDTSWPELLLGLLLFVSWAITDHFPPWPGLHNEIPAVLAGALMVFAALARLRRAQLTPMVAALLLAALVPWIQRATGLVPYAGDALVASLYLAGTALCLWAGGADDGPRGGGLLRTLAVALLVGALFCSLVALYQWFGLRGLNQIFVAEGVPGQRTPTNLGQPNQAATLILMGMAALGMLHAQRRLPPWVSAPLLLLLVIGLALTRSRVPWAAIVALAAWLAARRAALFEPLRLRASMLWTLLALYVLAFWAAGWLPGLLFDDHADVGVGARLKPGLRPYLWAQWLEALRLSPWVGYGWGQGHAAQAAAATTVAGFEFSPYAHNLLLDLLAWNGLPLGGLMALGLLAWYFRLGLRARGAEAGFAFAVLTLFGVHAMLEYPFAYAYLLLPAALAAGWLEAQPGVAPRWRVPRGVLAVIGLAVLIGFGALVRDYFRLESDIRLLREQTARIGGLRTLGPPEDVWVLDQLDSLNRALRVVPRAGMPEEELQRLRREARYFPSVMVLQRSALALAANGQEDEARGEMKQLCALHGDNYYLVVLEQMQDQVRERVPQARAFVESLGSIDDLRLAARTAKDRACAKH